MWDYIVGRNETQILQAQCSEIYKSNYPIPINRDWKLSPVRSTAGYPTKRMVHTRDLLIFLNASMDEMICSSVLK